MYVVSLLDRGSKLSFLLAFLIVSLHARQSSDVLLLLSFGRALKLRAPTQRPISRAR